MSSELELHFALRYAKSGFSTDQQKKLLATSHLTTTELSVDAYTKMSSFFTLPASQRKRKRTEHGISKAQISAKSRKTRDESISGSDDGSDDEVPPHPTEDASLTASDTEDEDFADEDPAAKRIRLASQYLANTQKAILAEENQVGFDAKDVDQENLRRRMGDRLKEDTAETKGKLYRWIASDFAWNRATKAQFRHHQKAVTGVAVSGEWAFTVGKDGILVKWRLPSPLFDSDARKSRKPQRTLISRPFGKDNDLKYNNHHSGPIRCIAVSQDGKFVATGGQDKKLIVWDTATLKVLKVFPQHRDAVLSLSFRRGTNQLFSASRDRTVKIWSLDELAYVETLFGHQDEVVDVGCLAQEVCITVGARDRTARLWKVVEETQLVFRGGGAPRRVNPYDNRPVSHEGSLDRVACIDDELFVTGSDNGSIALWNIHKKKAVHVYPLAHGVDEPLPLEDVSPEEFPEEKERRKPLARWVTALEAIPFTDVFVSGSWDGYVRVWKVSKDKRRIEPLGRLGVSEAEPDAILGAEHLTMEVVKREAEASEVLTNGNGVVEAEPIHGTINDLAIVDVGERAKHGVIVLAAVGKEHRLGRWKEDKEAKNLAVLFEVPRVVLESEEVEALIEDHVEDEDFAGFD